MTPKKQYIIDAYGREPESLDELAHCVIAVINSLENRDSWERRKKSHKYKNHRVVGFAWDIRRSETVSNSHSAPEGFPQNWGGRETMEDGTPVPRGYPGWTGRVWIRYEDEPRSFGSGPFERTLTYTGTGGAGSYDGFSKAVASARWQRYGYKSSKDAYPEVQNYSWDFRFYDADWPKIAEWYEKMKLVAILSDTNPVASHTFEWQDPETMIRDAEFIAECAMLKAKEKV